MGEGVATNEADCSLRALRALHASCVLKKNQTACATRLWRVAVIHNLAVRTGKVGIARPGPRRAYVARHDRAAATARAGLRQSLSRNRNQVSRDHHAVVPCIFRETARRIRRTRQRGRPGAGGITEQPRRPLHIADDILPTERNPSRRKCEASRWEASRCEAPSAAE